MQRVQVRVPASLTSVGTGLHSVGLALSMHCHITLQVRSDSELSVKVSGNGADKIPSTLDNLALRAAIRVFQQLEDAPVGLHVDVYNAIPFDVSMGVETAMVVGGLVAAHNLIDTKLSRDDLMRIAIKFNLPYEGIVTAMLGGIGIGSLSPNEPFEVAYTSIETPPIRAIIVRPDLNVDTTPMRFPETIKLVDGVRDMRQSLVLVEALRTGDFSLIKQALHDSIYNAALKGLIPNFEGVRQAALDAGAAGITLAGNGSQLLSFAEDEPFAVADAMVRAFARIGVTAQHWVLPIDQQGVVISALGESDIEEENPIKGKKKKKA